MIQNEKKSMKKDLRIFEEIGKKKIKEELWSSINNLLKRILITNPKVSNIQ